jgi:hypothetical protein
METLITYFLKVNGLLIGFYLVYFIFLKKETFFNWSRWYFLLGIVFSLFVPLLTYTKIIWVAPTPMPELPDFIPFQQTEIPVIIEESIDWNTIGFLFYGLVILILVGKMLVELTKLLVFLVKSKKTKVGSYFLIEQTSGQPFSFFNYVVFQKKNYTEAEIEAILQHEEVHVKQKHSVDVLLSQLFCCVFWVNPVCWWYKKAMQQNLEYIADAQTVAQTDSFIYQNLIVKATCSGSQLALTNPFYQSLIKKRILMINTTPSNKKSLWKYAVVLPLLTAFFLMFQIETVAQVRGNSNSEEKRPIEVKVIAVGFVTNKNTTDAEMKSDTKQLKMQGIDYKFSKVKRNKNGEIIALKIEFNDGKGNKGVKEIKGDNPIEPIYFSAEEGSIGFTSAPDLSDYVLDEKLSKQFGTEIKVKKNTEAVHAIAVAEYSENDNYNHIDKIKQNKLVDAKKALILFNGKEISYKDLDKIDLKSISSSGNMVAEHAVKKYGDKAKNGVIFINAKEYDMENNPLLKEMYEKVENENNVKIKEDSEQDKIEVISYDAGISIQWGKPNAENLIEDATKNSKVDYKNAVVVLNGKVIDYKKISSLDIITIGKITTKTATNELIKEYGEKAKNGVVYIDYKNNNIMNEPFNDKIDFNKNLKKNKPEPKTIELKNGDVVVVFDDKIKFPGYPTHFLNRLKIESKGKILEDNIEFFKNYDLKKIKDIKIELDSDSKENKVIRKLYIIE